MTKEELAVKLGTLEAKIEEQKHLASAVDAKDKEIVELKALIEKLKVEARDGNKAVVDNYKIQLDSLKKEYDSKKPLLETAEKLKKENESLLVVANGYIANFRSYLKATQGVQELAIEVEALLSEKLPKKQ